MRKAVPDFLFVPRIHFPTTTILTRESCIKQPIVKISYGWQKSMVYDSLELETIESLAYYLLAFGLFSNIVT